MTFINPNIFKEKDMYSNKYVNYQYKLKEPFVMVT